MRPANQEQAKEKKYQNDLDVHDFCSVMKITHLCTFKIIFFFRLEPELHAIAKPVVNIRLKNRKTQKKFIAH